MSKISSLIKNKKIVNQLNDLGIKSSFEFLEKTSHPDQRKQLAKMLGVDENDVLKWACIADLLRIKGLKIKDAKLLVTKENIRGVQDLKNIDIAQLSKKRVKNNRDKQKAHRGLSLDKITQYVKKAKNIEPLLILYIKTNDDLERQIAVLEKRVRKNKVIPSSYEVIFLIAFPLVIYLFLVLISYPDLSMHNSSVNVELAKYTISFVRQVWLLKITALWCIFLILWGFLIVLFYGYRLLQLFLRKFIVPRLFPDRLTYIKFLNESKDAINFFKKPFRGLWALVLCVIILSCISFIFLFRAPQSEMLMSEFLPIGLSCTFALTSIAVFYLYLSFNKLKLPVNTKIIKEVNAISGSIIMGIILLLIIFFIQGIAPIFSYATSWFIPKLFTPTVVKVVKEYQLNIQNLPINKDEMIIIREWSHNFINFFKNFPTFDLYKISPFISYSIRYLVIPTIFLFALLFIFVPFVFMGKSTHKIWARRLLFYVIVSCIVSWLLSQYLPELLFLRSSSYLGIVTFLLISITVGLIATLLPQNAISRKRLCPFCGHKISFDQKYCSNCGGRQDI